MTLIFFILKYFVTGIFFFYLLYLSGRFVLNCFGINQKTFFSLFLSLIVGLTTVSLLYASIRSCGRTVLLITTIPAILLIIRHKHQLQKPRFDSRLLRSSSWLFFAFLVIFIYQCLFFVNIKTFTFNSLYADSYWYSSFGDSQHVWGIENYFTQVNRFSPSSGQGLVPYHYPEFWMTSLVSKMVGLSTLNVYFLIICPALIAIGLIGIVAILETKLTHLKSFILALGLMFLSGVALPVYNNFHLLQYSGVIADVSLMGLFGMKYAFVFPFLILALSLFYNDKKETSLIVFSTIPLFYIGLLPALWGGLLLYFFYRICKDKKDFFVNYLFPMIVFFATAAGFVIFYQTFKSGFSTDVFQSMQNRHESLIAFIKPFAGNFVVYLIRISIVFFPFFIILIPLIKLRKDLPFLIAGMIFCGIMASSLFLGFTDGSQFANNSFLLFPILAILSIDVAIKRHNRLILSFVGILLLYGFFAAVTLKNKGTTWFKEDSSSLKSYANMIQENNAIILVFLDAKGYSKYGFASWHIHNDSYQLKQYCDKNIFFTP